MKPRSDANENNVERKRDMHEPDRADAEVKDLREANENIRKAQGDDELGTPVDQQRAGNKPRFDRDR